VIPKNMKNTKNNQGVSTEIYSRRSLRQDLAKDHDERC
jgi:hypothetical protein